MAANYDDVLGQLRSAGLIVDELRTGEWVRCKIDGDREKRGWYKLHSLQVNGEELLVGSFGFFRGMDSNTMKVELTRRELSRDQLDSLRRRLAEDKRRAENSRRAEAERAARRAAKAWAACSAAGDCDYLAKKSIGAHGIRFSPSGAAVVPMLDVSGKIHGLQVIRNSAAVKSGRLRQKEYWPKGMSTRGHFHLIGSPIWIVLVCEGYATGASLYEATGHPVAVAFDAGNLAAVAAALRKRYRGVHVLICADDDVFTTCRQCKAKVVLSIHPTHCPSCFAEHGRTNAGVTAASTAALECEGAWVKPQFGNSDARVAAYETRGTKLTDFNDLHVTDGLHVVRTQIEVRLGELQWSPPARAGARLPESGGAGKEALRPIETVDELLERYALVYGKGGTVFDRREHCLLSLSDMRDACISKYIHRAWAEHPQRCIVREREVGFDPAGEDPAVTCNLWSGWPTSPTAGRCDRLLELLRYMCSEETQSEALYKWVLCWIAYPIQHAGAKMKTTLVLHGPQGTGKNMFFEALMAIYDRYGRVVDQAAIEDKFNDWASRKLFLIADEVVARSDLYHVKNKLKAFITGDWIRINPKNFAAYDERNHVNICFLSNETMPVVLEEDDRRHAVIWTPSKLTQAFYDSVKTEIDSGGIAALHHYLLHLDLADFKPSTLPPMTEAKKELIGLSLDSTSRFFHALEAGDLGVEPRPALSSDVYELYKAWCGRCGLRAAPLPKLVNALDRKHRIKAVRKRYFDIVTLCGPHGVLMLGTAEMPPGAAEAQWLGEHISSFRTAVKDYRGAAYA